MRCWTFAIVGQSGVEIGSGWIRAQTNERALALVWHPDVSIYEIGYLR